MTNNVTFGAFKPATSREIREMGEALNELRERSKANKISFLKKYSETRRAGQETSKVCQEHLYVDKLNQRTFAIQRDKIVRGDSTSNLNRCYYNQFSQATKKLERILKGQNDPNTTQISKIEEVFDGRNAKDNFMSKAAGILLRSDLDPKDEATIARYINAIRQSADEAFSPSLIGKIKKFFGF